MAVRTTSDLVAAILARNMIVGTDMTPYIAAATILTDRVAACATAKGYPLSTVELELIERWLSAHFYTKMDPVYSSRSTAGASGSFVRSSKEPEPYKDGALMIDTSGCLNAILNRLVAGMEWLGKTSSEQIAAVDRD